MTRYHVKIKVNVPTYYTTQIEVPEDVELDDNLIRDYVKRDFEGLDWDYVQIQDAEIEDAEVMSLSGDEVG
jgi:hypothetical protein